MRSALAAAAILLVLVVAGCGSSAGSGTTDPATVAPPSTLAYFSFELDPDEPERDDFDAAFAKLIGPDPRERIGELFTQAVQTSGRLSYGEDMKPWLGKTATVIVTRVNKDDVDFALLVATTDEDKARDAIAKDLAGTRNVGSEYRGVDYRVMPDRTANGVVEGFLVAGTHRAFRAVVDAAAGEESLAATDAWKRAVAERDDGKVGLAYVDGKRVLQSLAVGLPGAQSVVGPLLIGLLDLEPFVGTLAVKPDRLVLDVSSPGTRPDPRGPRAASSELIEGLPADSWFALASPKVGQTLQELIAALQANPIIGAQYRGFATRLERATGLDLEADVLAALGDLGVFVRGGTRAAADAGIVVASPNPRTLRRTVAKLPPLVARAHDGRLEVTRRGRSGFDVASARMPRVLQVRVAGGRAVAGYGPAATRDGLRPSARLGSSALFRRAASAIGGRPSLFVALEPAIAAAARSPHGGPKKRLAQLLLGRRALSYAAVGARRDGGLDVVRAVLGLR